MQSLFAPRLRPDASRKAEFPAPFALSFCFACLQECRHYRNNTLLSLGAQYLSVSKLRMLVTIAPVSMKV